MTHYELICGGREYADFAAVERRVMALRLTHEHVVIVQGGARGADALARRASVRVLGSEGVEIQAEWELYGKSAGFRRNELMARFLVARRNEGHTVGVTAFTGGNGTRHMVRTAQAMRLPVEVRD